MLIVESIHCWNVLLVPPFVACLRTSDQQQGNATRIEGIEDSVGLSPVLNPKLPKAAVARTRR